MKIGIDLLSVKPQKTGGLEAYVRNLLDGFNEYGDEKFEFVLFVAKDNYEYFEKITNKAYKLIMCNVNSNEVGKRIIWENLFLGQKCKSNSIDILFVPIYSKPIFNCKNIKYVTTIHDLQAIHYPEYFSKKKVLWLKFAWKRSCDTSDKIIAISEYVKKDIMDNFNVEESKIQAIYNPITRTEIKGEFSTLEEKLKIKSGEYYYTVSQLLPHKNLKTLLYVIKDMVDKNIAAPKTLVISGVGGKDKGELLSLIEELHIKENVILTGFVSNEERDLLYKNAALFLFPSIFEGFGMPPVEAMEFGTPVITTKCSCIPEVTEGKADYVEDPFDKSQWIEKICLRVKDNGRTVHSFPNYSLEKITKQYLKCFDEVNRND